MYFLNGLKGYIPCIIMSSYIFPCQYVFWKTVDNHTEIKQKLMPVIEQIKNDFIKDHNPFESCTMVSSLYHDDRVKHSEINSFLMTSDLLKLVWNTVDENIKHLVDKGIDCPVPKNSICTESWFNIYGKNHHQEMHRHMNAPFAIDGDIYTSSYSIVYILNDDAPDENSLVFRNIMEKSYASGDHKLFKTREVPTIKEGTILVFPSSLDHYIEPVKKAGRITIIYNIMSSWNYK